MRLNWGTAPISAFQIFELCLVLLAILIAFLRPRFASAFCTRVEGALTRISNRPWLCAAILFSFPIALRLMLLPVYGVPAPFISDEYAYLLQSDTFSSGRLANPIPPLPQHFTSVYILTEPTYTAEYQIGQGLSLAVGQLLTGIPWAGVLLSMGLLCALIYWALLAWIPGVWAFTGTLVAVDISLGVLSYWMNSYWGGCVPAIGGTLALGALPRILGKKPVLHALISAAGLAILFNSRPLEGVFLGAVVAGTLLCWTFRTHDLSFRKLLRQVLPASAGIALVTVAFAGFYNHRVTGDPKEFPYLLYRSRYGLPQGFFWQKPVLVNAAALPLDIRSEYEDQLRQHERRRSPRALIGATGGKLRRFWEFYIGVPLTVTLVFLPFIWRGKHMQLALWSLLVVLGVDNLLFFAFFPHYAAPVTLLIVLVIIQCFRRMRATGAPGLFLSRALTLICFVGLFVPMAGRFLETLMPDRLQGTQRLWQSEFVHDLQREAFTPRLESEPGQHLVLVRYGPENGQKKFEWIYNRANLATAKIIWARYSDDAASNEALRERFPGRKLWLAEPDASPPRVTPFTLPSHRGASQ